MLTALAKRNRGTHLDKCHNSELTTNLFKVGFREETKICIYAAKTQPEIAHDNTKRLRAILMHSRKIIERLIGTYATSGRTVFGTKEQHCGKGGELTFKVDYEGVSYQFVLKLVKEVAMSDIHSPDCRKSGVVYSFLNNLLKNFFHQLDYTEIGRSRKYFDSKHYQQLESAKVIIYKGYSSSFTMLQDGLFLRMDPAVKIVRNETALDIINRVYARNSSLAKQEKRLVVERELVGKMVMANYGKNAYHVIESVLFDSSLDTYNFFNGKEDVSLFQYYKDNYGIEINAKRQPLLRAVIDRKTKEQAKEIVLIPELLLMSGLPDDFDERKRREISEQTIVPPSHKMKELSQLFSRFNSDSEGFNPAVVADRLGIKLDSTPTKIRGKQLNIPELQLGRRQKIDSHKATSFMLFNKPLYSSEVALKIAVICPSEFDLGQVKDLMKSTCSNLELEHRLVHFPIKYQERGVLKNIEQIVEKQSGESRESCNIFWIIIPNNFKTNYGSLKKIVLRAGIEKNSQICLTSTFQKKGFNSVMTKILLQMAAKVGNTLWVPKVSSSIPSAGVMMIGIEECPDSFHPGRSVLSFCSNTNRECSSFHSNFLMTSGSKTHMNEIVIQCLSEYLRCSNESPSDILLIKNGSSKYDNPLVVQTEVAEIKEVLKSVKKESVKVIYILLDKDTSQKFFAERGREVVNPQSGMLVNSQAVGNGFQFYLVAQQCNRGTVRPTFYRALYSDSGLESGVIEELLYSQCFNYMNWTGSIKVPSVVQYAKKQAMFVGQYLGDNCVGEGLSRSLYFI